MPETMQHSLVVEESKLLFIHSFKRQHLKAQYNFTSKSQNVARNINKTKLYQMHLFHYKIELGLCLYLDVLLA